MATEQQKAAVEKLVEIGGTSVSRAMRESRMPYSPKTAKTPKKLTESKGFKEICGKYGLTEGLILKALVDDIKGKPKSRVKELTLGAEILKMKDKEQTGNTFNTIIFTDDRATKIARRIIAGNSESETEPR